MGILEWVAFPFSRGSSQPGSKLRSAFQANSLPVEPPGKPKIRPYSVRQFSCSVVSDSLRPHESQYARPPCPSPTPGVHSNSRPSSRWCHPAISSSVVPSSSCPQSLPASESFLMSQLFAWGGQSYAATKGKQRNCTSMMDRNDFQGTDLSGSIIHSHHRYLHCNSQNLH